MFINKTRLNILELLFQGYIQNSIQSRMGFCNYQNCKAQCGCKSCKYMNKDYSCSVYTKRNDLTLCNNRFPTDSFEIWYYGFDKCGYYWEDDNRFDKDYKELKKQRSIKV